MLFKAILAMLLIFIALLTNNNISLCEELCENGHLIDETNSSLDFTGICLFLGSPFFLTWVLKPAACWFFGMLSDLDSERITALYNVQTNGGVVLNNLNPEFTSLIKSSSPSECRFIYFSSFKSQFEILVKYSETSPVRDIKIGFVYSENFARFCSENQLLIKPNTEYYITLVELFVQSKTVGNLVLDPDNLGSITTHLINPSDNIMIDEICNLIKYFAKK